MTMNDLRAKAPFALGNLKVPTGRIREYEETSWTLIKPAKASAILT